MYVWLLFLLARCHLTVWEQQQKKKNVLSMHIYVTDRKKRDSLDVSVVVETLSVHTGCPRVAAKLRAWVLATLLFSPHIFYKLLGLRSWFYTVSITKCQELWSDVCTAKRRRERARAFPRTLSLCPRGPSGFLGVPQGFCDLAAFVEAPTSSVIGVCAYPN